MKMSATGVDLKFGLESYGLDSVGLDALYHHFISVTENHITDKYGFGD